MCQQQGVGVIGNLHAAVEAKHSLLVTWKPHPCVRPPLCMQQRDDAFGKIGQAGAAPETSFQTPVSGYAAFPADIGGQSLPRNVPDASCTGTVNDLLIALTSSGDSPQKLSNDCIDLWIVCECDSNATLTNHIHLTQPPILANYTCFN